jgi:hypothetical protein
MKNYKMIQAYLKIVKVIDSCQDVYQLNVANRMIRMFIQIWKEATIRHMELMDKSYSKLLSFI